MYELQVLVASNASPTSIPSTPAQPVPFSPPTYAVWGNLLWFLSLAISLTCAMLATLLQQWARRYLRITQPPRYTPHDRARIRAFFAHGVDKFHLSRAADALPILIQLSLFLFFAGLLVYLFNINHTVFRAVAWWVAVSVAIYVLITLMPIFWLESPFYSPLSSLTWSLYSSISYLVSLLFCCICCCDSDKVDHLDERSSHYRSRIFQRIENISEATIQSRAPEIDDRILKWTFHTLIEDHELQWFFQCILGFRSSTVVQNPQKILERLGDEELSSALVAFLHRTWSSNLVSESDKLRRLVVCVKVADAARLLDATWQILDGVFNGDGRAVLESIEAGHFLKTPGNANDETYLCAQSIIGCIIANAGKGDRPWIALAANHLGKPEDELRAYPGHESVLLANLVHVTRQFHKTHRIILRGRMLPSNSDRPQDRVISQFTRSLSKFDIRRTSAELQHDFCALWNELVEDIPRSGGDGLVINTLIGFRQLYLALHHGTDAAPIAFTASTADEDGILRRAIVYPRCNLPSHHPEVN
jgi:Family of unknown function (DUF6535)